MDIYSTYSVKIKHYNHIFKNTITVYRDAVDFLIDVCDAEWSDISLIEGKLNRQGYVEDMVHYTKSNPTPKYPMFDKLFYKMPSYMRRAAISEAIGKITACSRRSIAIAYR